MIAHAAMVEARMSAIGALGTAAGGNPSSSVCCVDLSAVDELAVAPETEDRVLISWRVDEAWTTHTYVAAEDGYVDPDQVLWWLLSHGAQVGLIRSAFRSAYSDFDVGAEIDHVTMPDRAERRAEDRRRRAEVWSRRVRPKASSASPGQPCRR